MLHEADLTVVAIRAGRGDTAAFEVFVERTFDDVVRYCAHLTDAGSADDLAQITYLEAMRSLPRFRGDSSARTWLLGIARHTSFDELRARRRRDRLVTALRAVPDDGRGIRVDHRLPLELVEAMAALDVDRREAFVLTQLLGLGYAEAAELVGVPIGTIRSRVSRARGHLLDFLRESERNAATGPPPPIERIT